MHTSFMLLSTSHKPLVSSHPGILVLQHSPQSAKEIISPYVSTANIKEKIKFISSFLQILCFRFPL